MPPPHTSLHSPPPAAISHCHNFKSCTWGWVAGCYDLKPHLTSPWLPLCSELEGAMEVSQPCQRANITEVWQLPRQHKRGSGKVQPEQTGQGGNIPLADFWSCFTSCVIFYKCRWLSLHPRWAGRALPGSKHCLAQGLKHSYSLIYHCTKAQRMNSSWNWGHSITVLLLPAHLILGHGTRAICSEAEQEASFVLPYLPFLVQKPILYQKGKMEEGIGEVKLSIHTPKHFLLSFRFPAVGLSLSN